jgi:pimeloyl-ACP methyl ester carboxylesterase
VSRGRRLLSIAAIALAAALVTGAVFPTGTLNALRRVMLWSAGTEHGTVIVDGQPLAWCAVGKGRPVLLQHGLRGESAVMLPLARALAARGYRVLMFDLPGHGLSPQPVRELTIGNAGKLILDAADALDFPRRPAIVGHSLGGWVMAWQALESPQRCGPVTLISSPGYRFQPPAFPMLLPFTVSDAQRSLPIMFAHPPYAPAPALWFAVRRDASTAIAMLRSAVSGEYLLDGLLGSIDLPVQILFGAQDKLIPPAIGRAMAADLPGHRFEEIADAGHMVVWEKPEETAAAIDRFLSEVGAATPAN